MLCNTLRSSMTVSRTEQFIQELLQSCCGLAAALMFLFVVESCTPRAYCVTRVMAISCCFFFCSGKQLFQCIAFALGMVELHLHTAGKATSSCMANKSCTSFADLLHTKVVTSSRVRLSAGQTTLVVKAPPCIADYTISETHSVGGSLLIADMNHTMNSVHVSIREGGVPCSVSPIVDSATPGAAWLPANQRPPASLLLQLAMLPCAQPPEHAPVIAWRE